MFHDAINRNRKAFESEQDEMKKIEIENNINTFNRFIESNHREIEYLNSAKNDALFGINKDGMSYHILVGAYGKKQLERIYNEREVHAYA
jgi:hypothetical protein